MTAVRRVRSVAAAAFALFAAVAACPASRAAQLDYSDTTPFTRQVAANFVAWDGNGDGVLSGDEVDRRVLDPLVAGDAAAALGAIKTSLRRAVNRPRKSVQVAAMDRDYFRAYGRWAHSRRGRKQQAEAEEVLGAQAGGAADPDDRTEFPDFDRLYRAGVQRLRRGANGGDLFGPDDPRFDRIRQGATGDCYLLSVLGGLVFRDPASVRRMVSPLPDRSTVVTFPSGRVVHLPPMTDTERILYGSGGGAGTRWLTVIEEAFGKLRNESLPEERRRAVSSDLVVGGGSPRRTLGAITGSETEGMGFPRRGPERLAPATEEVAPLLPALREGLKAATSARRLIVAGTNSAPCPPGVTGKHAYAVLGFDAAADTVRVWNPHRNDFTPAGPAGVENGYPTRAGIFEVPLAEFPRVFTGVSWETGRRVPAAKPGTAGAVPARRRGG